MRIADADRNPGAFAVTVSCLRCHRRRQLAEVRADLDGPAFFAYFCDPGCVPTDATDATFVYMANGWQNVAGNWRQG